jgi:hypothetical protein
MKLLIAFLLIFVVGCCSIKNDEVNLSKKDINFHNEIIKNIEDTLYKINPSLNDYHSRFSKDLKSRTKYGEYLYNFAVNDITDTNNSYDFMLNELSIKFINGHVYHFHAFIPFNDRSGLLIIYSNNFKIFHSINCDEPSASKIEDVIDFVQDSVDVCDKDFVIKRIINYRNYTDLMPEFNYEGRPEFNCD